MKRLLFVLLAITSVCFSQYNDERTTEQSFENSPLFFNSSFINTYGLTSFQKVLPGLVKDPFMDIYLNPANVPDLKGNDILVYIDFTSDRQKQEIINYYPYPYYYLSDTYYAPTLDPRWLSNSRQEPAPIATLGIITNPLGKNLSEFIVGATYQLLYKEDRFYNVPYWIYNYSPYLDSFNSVRTDESDQNIPVIDRYSGTDHMTTDGHLLNIFASYQLSDELSLGINFSGVWHNRDGSYLDQSQDEYGDFDDSEWSNKQFQERSQEYSHTDFSAGIKYSPDEKTGIGLKLGYLKGTADQIYSSENEYLYKYSIYNNDANWSESFSESFTNQIWKHDGDVKYLGLYYDKLINENTSVKLFYRYNNSSLDLTSSSSITDTSYYESSWVSTYNYDESHSLNYSSTKDFRNSTGTKDVYSHEVGCYINWILNDNIKFSAGLYYQMNSSETKTNEPVLAHRYSYYDYTHTNYPNNRNSLTLNEDKLLEWNYESKYWTLQIPMILNIQATENLGIILGLARKLETWNSEDVTTAYFIYRDEMENERHIREENFGERYRQPETNISENTTDFFAGLNITISEKLLIRLLVDPDLNDSPKFKQWHLSFYGLL